MRSLPLGYSPASGNDSVTHCMFFKAVLRERIGRDPDGAYIRTIVAGRKRGLEVEFDPEVPGATCWAEQALAEADGCWEQVLHRRQARGRAG
jgi:hypothetical protein